MKEKKKLLILSSIIIGVMVVVLGLTYAFFVFNRSGGTGELVLGDIWMRYTETNGISLNGALPGDAYSKYFQFTITGKNTYEEKDIWYDIRLTKGDVPEGKTEANRIEDKYLKFKLVEVNGDVETEILKDKTYDNLTNQTIHVATIPKDTKNYTKTYRLYMVISENLKIGDSEGSVTNEEFGNLFGSIKVAITGDFTEKEVPRDLSGAESIIENVATYAAASASDFEGGLVAINGTEGSDYGHLYNENNQAHTIREYRYSGLNVNNYAYFNCKDTDGTYNYGDDNYDYQNNCEVWRIVGTFKNSNDEWNLKLMRNTILTSDELPATYVVDGTTYTIEIETSANACWNNPDTLKSTNYSDWWTAGLQYFLNTTSDTNGTAGYYGALSSKTKELIDENYTYYLGNVVYGSSGDTTKTAYANERDETKKWDGNQSSWNGAVALLYPSDYGYSALSSHWNTVMYDYSGGAMDTSWMQKEANHSTLEWLLSPSSNDGDYALYWDSYGYVNYRNVYLSSRGVRPVLNLKSSAKIKTGEGTTNSPYVIIAG